MHPIEFYARSLIAFGVSLGVTIVIGPSILELLHPFHQEVLSLSDHRYQFSLALTHQTGHDTNGPDLVLLVQAIVLKAIHPFGNNSTAVLHPGQLLKSSTAIGIFLQPVVVTVGALLAWPIRSSNEKKARIGLGMAMILAWLLLGIPALLWIYVEGIPAQVYEPDAISWVNWIGKLSLNGGASMLGGILATGTIALSKGGAPFKLRRGNNPC